MNFNLIQRPNVIPLMRLLQARRLQQLAARAELPTANCKQTALECKQLYPGLAAATGLARFNGVPTIPTATRGSSTNAYDAKAVGGEDEVLELEEVPGHALKSLLYEETDAIMTGLNASQNYEQLLQRALRYAEASDPMLDRQHMVQTVVLLWSFFLNMSDERIAQSNVAKNVRLQQFLTKLHTHIPAMTLEEMSCCYLYLRRIGVPNTDATVEDLLMRALEIIEQTPATSPAPLFALSRLAVGINHGRDFCTPLVCKHFMPHIIAHMRQCHTVTDARQLAICMYNLQPLVGDSLEDYKLRIHQLLGAGILNEHSSKAINKILQMLNMPVWSKRNTKLIRDLLLTVQPRVAELNQLELRNVCRIFQYNLEPAGLSEPLKQATEQLLRTKPSAATLACFLSFAQPNKREKLIAIFKRLLGESENWSDPNASSNFFAILRGLKISDRKVCDAYWAGVHNELNECYEEEDIQQIRATRYCHRYMNFNNNLGGTYRYEPLERKLSRIAMDAIEGDIAGRIPQRFARMASFVLGYGWTPFGWKKFPNVILTRLIAMADQFSVTDCFVISRGLQIAMELRFRHHTPSILAMQIATIDNVLLACAERHLSSSEPLSLADLNLIVRSLSHKNNLKNSSVYQMAFNKYKTIDCSEELNSRTIREISYNFNASKFFIPEMLEKMFEYIEANHEHVMGDTVEKVLSCAYNLGYMPQSLDVLHYAAMILMRDFNYMSGLSIVQGCLALCFYKAIPEDLINRVFCVGFIQRIEEEIQMCYSKATYPERVLNLVMQLNRTVCLDFPEANVPWFQQNYLEAQLSKKPSVQNNFSQDVTKLLENLLKDKQYFRCNHTTPYGYQIDFVIHFDRNKKPIPPEPVETTMLDHITKVAILLLKLDSFCENDLTKLRGPQSLKISHLEMMGYKVLHVNEHDWNSKYMNAPGAKANYLKCLLQISK